MVTYHKMTLAGDMLLEAANAYRRANTAVEYIKCILLAGAVINMVYPLLEEYGIKSNNKEMAERAAKLSDKYRNGEPPAKTKDRTSRFLQYYNATYNSLKHSGDKKKRIATSADMMLELDLKDDAYDIITSAINDFKKIPFNQYYINHQLSLELLDLLNQYPWEQSYDD